MWLVLVEGIVVGIVLAVLIGGGRFAELESVVLIGRGIVVKIGWADLIGGCSFVETGTAILIGGGIVIKVGLALLIGEGFIIELGIPVACRGGVTAVEKAAQKINIFRKIISSYGTRSKRIKLAVFMMYLTNNSDI